MSTSDSAEASAAFDAYYELLGIPPAEQPPTYYRLLGLSPLEGNGKVIERAADRQMSHLRSFKSGDAAIASQQLLNEIAKATRVLLSPSEKSAYDRTLQRPGSVAPMPAPLMPLSMPVSAGSLMPAPQLPAPVIVTRLVQPVLTQAPALPMGRAVPAQVATEPVALPESNFEPREPENRQWLIFVAGGTACLVILSILAAARMLGSSEEVVEKAQAKGATAASDKIAPLTPASDRPASGPNRSELPSAAPLPVVAVPIATATSPDAGKSPLQSQNDTADRPAADSSKVSQPPQTSGASSTASKPPVETTHVASSEKAEEPARAKALPEGEWVDMFPLLRPKEDIVAGLWNFNGKELSALGKGMSKIRLPADLGDTSYDLQVEFISQTDPNNINVILPVGDRSVLLVGDGYLDVGTVSYFSVVRGKEPIHIPGHVPGQLLKPGVKYKYDISVRLLEERTQINFWLNDKDTFSYSGPIDDLRIVPVYRMADDGWPGLSTWFCPVTFLSCKLRLREGPGKLTREIPTSMK